MENGDGESLCFLDRKVGVWAPDMSSVIDSLEEKLVGALTQVRDFY